MFEQTLIESVGQTRKPWTVMVSFVGQVVLVGLGILVPLVYTEALPQARLLGHLIAPLPPRGEPPPPPSHSQSVKVEKSIPRQFTGIGLVEPGTVPETVATIVDMEAPPVPATALGTSGVPGGPGLPGGSLNPVIGSILSSIPTVGPPTPRPKAASATVRPKRITVGGLVQPPRPIRTPKPGYPPLARQARISGIVRLEAIIATDGQIQNVRLIRGHPLLAPAAIAAVREWLYTPSLLNGEPVEVIMQIDVNFTLSQ